MSNVIGDQRVPISELVLELLLSKRQAFTETDGCMADCKSGCLVKIHAFMHLSISANVWHLPRRPVMRRRVWNTRQELVRWIMERSALKAVINLVEVRSKSINLRIFLSCLNIVCWKSLWPNSIQMEHTERCRRAIYFRSSSCNLHIFGKNIQYLLTWAWHDSENGDSISRR